MVSATDSGQRGLGLSPGQGHCVMFLGKTLYSHGASLHPGLQMDTGNILVFNWTRRQTRVESLLVASCH